MQRIIKWIIRHTICEVFGHNTYERPATYTYACRLCGEDCGPKKDTMTMTIARYGSIMEGSEDLSIEEEEAGWHFCDSWNGLLVGPGMDELETCLCVPERAKANERAFGNNLYPMPRDLIGWYRNGGTAEPCDMLEGPCACGAWHHLYEWDENFLKTYAYPRMTPDARSTARIQRAMSHTAAEKLYGKNAIGQRRPTPSYLKKLP